MPDIYFPDTILQLRAVPDFIGPMNQATHLSDCCEITPGRITDTFGFLNSHSFLMTPGNKLKTYNRLIHVLTNTSSIGSIQYQNFTLETRVRFTSLTGIKYLFEIPGTVTSNAKRYGINAVGKLTFYNGASATVTQTDSEVITTGTDYHIAFVRGQGTQPGYNLKMFINGRKVVDVNNTTTNSQSTSDGVPLVFGGSIYSDTYDVSGYMDDIRITLGVARYSSNFTPPINDDFTVPDSSLWLPVRPNIKAKTIINIARNNHSLYPPTSSGSKKAKISLVAKHNVTNFDFADYSGNNTINAVAQIDGVPSSGLLINLLHRGSKRIIRTTKSGLDGTYALKKLASNVDFMILGEDNIAKEISQRRNAYVRDFVKLTGFVNLSKTNPVSTNLSTGINSSPIAINSNNVEDLIEIFPYSDTLDGDPYRDNVVLALDFQGETFSKLFTDFNNPDRLFSIVNTDIELIEPIRGKSSLKLSGSNSYAYSENNPEDFYFPDDFTIEFSIKTTDINGYILSFGSQYGLLWGIYLNAAGNLVWSSYGTINSTSPINDNIKKDIAISRKNNIIYMFVNGFLVASATNSNNITNTQTTTLAIGAQYLPRNVAMDFQGQIGKIKITKGIGRYDSSYILPSDNLLTLSKNNIILNKYLKESTFTAQAPVAGNYKLKFKSPSNSTQLEDINFIIS